MNPLGVHALVWTGGWDEAERRMAVTATKAAGYDIIEIPLLDPGTVDGAATGALLDAAGLQATCSLGLSLATDISSDDSAIVRRGEELLTEALTCSEAMGSRYLGGVIYSALAKYAAPATARGRANSAAVLKRLARRARDAGVTVGLEVVNRYETNLLNTAAQALDFVREIDEPNVGVHLDSYHMNIEENDLSAPIRLCGEHLVYAHVGENHRGYLGSGNVDFATFFRALAEIGYEGPITFESFSSAVVSPTLSNALGVWRNLWSDGHDLATRARAFVAAHLR